MSGQSLAASAAVAYALHDEPADASHRAARPPLRTLVSSLRHRGWLGS